MDFTDSARLALRPRQLSDVDKDDVSGTFVYKDQGARIHHKELATHIEWARRKNETVLIEAACADGKRSGMIKQYVEMKEQTPKLLVYVPRQTLAQGIHAEYNNAGLKIWNYLDGQCSANKELFEGSGIILPESTHKLITKNFSGPDDVMFDEANMFLRLIAGADTPFKTKHAITKPVMALKYIKKSVQMQRLLLLWMQTCSNLPWV